MVRSILWIVLAISFVVGTAVRADPLRFDEPDRLSSDVMALLTQGSFHDAAAKIANTVGKPDAVASLETALKILEGKNGSISAGR